MLYNNRLCGNSSIVQEMVILPFIGSLVKLTVSGRKVRNSILVQLWSMLVIQTPGLNGPYCYDPHSLVLGQISLVIHFFPLLAFHPFLRYQLLEVNGPLEIGHASFWLTKMLPNFGRLTNRLPGKISWHS